MEVCTFYRFVRLADLEGIQARLLALGESLGVRGTVLLGEEGVNSTMCGTRPALERFLAGVREVPGLEDLPAKFSRAESGNDVFHRLKIRIKPEIVTLGVPGLDPSRRTGEHVDAARWNALLDDPEVIVIDTRNRYECAIGTFPGAVQPDTDTFREFPRWVESHLDPSKHRRVAMFCTGGIRCEKASAFMLEAGFESVYQLDGGILQYLETVGTSTNRWQGECFVFDQRVSVDDSLGEGDYSQCYACRHPLSPDDRAHPDYAEGIRCPHCAGTVDARRAAAFTERRRQVVLAAQRGHKHVGERQVPGKATAKVRRSV